MTFIHITCMSDRSEEVLLLRHSHIGMTHHFLRRDRVDWKVSEDNQELDPPPHKDPSNLIFFIYIIFVVVVGMIACDIVCCVNNKSLSSSRDSC